MTMTTMMLSPTPSTYSSDGSGQAQAAAISTTSPRSAVIASSGDSGSGTPSPATASRNAKAHQAATIAAIVESTTTHRHLIPGMAELLGGSKDKIMSSNVPFVKGSGGGGGTMASKSSLSETVPTKYNVDGDATTSALATDTSVVALGHPSLPSMDAVSNTANRFISEIPPFVTMSTKDSAPQLKLESPPATVGTTGTDTVYNSRGNVDKTNDASALHVDFADFQRKLIVKGGMKGYRMSRATHGVSSGCYYYEAIILGSSDEIGSTDSSCDKRGKKRPLQELEMVGEQHHQLQQETKPDSSSTSNNEQPTPMQKSNNRSSMNGHLRIGWSTRLADLQAPVGYNTHSYAIRDIMGSRIHNSHRQDKWGGIGFGPGDVLGVALYLVDGKTPPTKSTVSNAATISSNSSTFNPTDGIDSEKQIGSSSSDNSESIHERQLSTAPLNNHIRFFLNGKPMGNENGIAFDNIQSGTYHPAVSCYDEGSAWLNFGPNFVYPPMHLPPEMNPRPISDLCHTPPLSEEVIETVISGGSGCKRGGHIMNLSKRAADYAIVSAFKELVGIEAASRRRAYLKHLALHRLEISAMRKERGLSTLDLV
jgi:hypothetical protein